MKESMEGKSPEKQVVELKRLADLFPAEDRQGQIHWLDLAQRDPAANTEAYDNAACAADFSDAETSFSDGQLDHEEKFFSAMDLDKGEKIEVSPTGSDQNLIEDERIEVKGELEMSPSKSGRSRSVQFQEKPNVIPKSLIRDETDETHISIIEDSCASMAPQGFLNRKSFDNKSFMNDWQTETAVNQHGTKGQNGKARRGTSAGEASSNYLDNNSNVKDRMEAKEAGKGGAAKGGGKTETGYRVSLRRILRHFSERRERSAAQRERRYFNAPSASNIQPSSLLPSALASRRQSEGDVHSDSTCWPRRSSLQLVNGVSGMALERWRMDDMGKTNEAGTTTPRRSSITITTHFGEVEDGRTKTDGWTNGHLDPIPSISRDIGDSVARRMTAGSTAIQIVGGGSVESAATVGEVQPAMIEDTGESFFRILLETVFPFIMAGFGCAFAGIVLDIVQVTSDHHMNLISSTLNSTMHRLTV